MIRVRIFLSEDQQYDGSYCKFIRVNAVGPAFINTPLLTEAGIDDATKKNLFQLHPTGRLGESQEVAELVVWLSSGKASFLAGSYYPVIVVLWQADL